MSALIDGLDTTTIGFVTSDWPNIRSAMEFDYPVTRISGRDGAVHLSRIGQGQGRDRFIDWIGYGRAVDHATLLTNLAELKWRCMRREVEIGLSTDPGWAWTAVLVRGPIPPMAPAETQKFTHLTWTFQLLDAVAHATSNTVIDFTAGATACPTDNIPSFPFIEIVGPVTNPEIILTSGSGAEIVRLSLIVTVGAGETLEIDCNNIQLSIDGVVDNDIAITGDFPWLDPLHYSTSSPSSTPPSLAVTGSPASAIATYVKKRG